MRKLAFLAATLALIGVPLLAGQVPDPLNKPSGTVAAGHLLVTTSSPQQTADGGVAGALATKGTGTSVVDPGTGLLEAVLPVQTTTGASKGFLSADLYKETRRSNSGSAMSDTFPASNAVGLVNGTRIVTNNVDATATDTITAGAGTTINSGATALLGPQRSVTWVYDAPNTVWRSTLNGTTMALTTQPNAFSKLQTLAGGEENTTVPVVDVVGSEYLQHTTYNLPGSGSLLRPIYLNDTITLPSSGSSAIIHEKQFNQTDYNWSGAFTLSGESNEFHAFALDHDAGCTTSTSCTRSGRRGGFEFSGQNDINITGQITPFYDAYINNATGHVSSYIEFGAGITNNNTTAGAIGNYAIIDTTGVGGTGSKPTSYASFTIRDAAMVMDHMGPVVIGSLQPGTSGGSQLYIKGTGTGSDSDILIRDSGNNIKFNFTSDGKLVGSNEISGFTNIRGVSFGLGLGASVNATTLTVSGLTNINNSVNAVTNIGNGTTTAAVVIGNSANTTTLGGPSVLSSNTVSLTGSTFSASGCTAVTVAATTGALGCTVSDRRLKLDGGVFSDDAALADILAMPDLHTYQFQYGQGPGGHFVGYFAQDVQAVHPGWVLRGAATELTPDGTLQYDQNHPTSELVGAVKALNRKIADVAAGLPATNDDPLVPLNAKLHRQQLEIYLLFAWCLGLTVVIVRNTSRKGR